MKLRIRDNHLRLRLQRQELATLQAAGRVQATLPLGPASGLTYALRVTREPAITLHHAPDSIEVGLPEAMLLEWVHTDRVGWEVDLQVSPDTPVRITIEKDFRCLVERPGEDDADAFHNPDTGTAC